MIKKKKALNPFKVKVNIAYRLSDQYASHIHFFFSSNDFHICDVASLMSII